MAYYCWRLGGVRRTAPAGRLSGLRIFWRMAGFETMCRDDFGSCSYLDLEKMK
jgi:hypothetical protein